MIKESDPNHNFSWSDIGNIEEGRPNLGPTTTVASYRLFQFTMRDVLIKKYGLQTADELFIEAGRLAGKEFYRNQLNLGLEFNAFVAKLQELLKSYMIGVLRIEKADLPTLALTLTVSEDLDCSGLPMTGETVCNFDEGFIQGVFEEYTGKTLSVKEIDCWASGGRVCRFKVTRKEIP